MTLPLTVLFITADKWRGGRLGALGHRCLETPNLDRLAARGKLFTRRRTRARLRSMGRPSA